jgi:AcrR family transcriptional regulator
VAGVERRRVDVAQPALADSRSGGRPRDDSRDRAIRRATLQLLAEVGYDGVTMDRVATRAKAGKATIYRRWPSKVALVIETIAAVARQAVPIPDTGSFRADMLALLRAYRDSVGDDRGRVLAELISELPRNADLRDAVQKGFITQRKVAMDAIIARAVARGEIDPAVDRVILMELGSAIVLQRILLSGLPVDDSFLETIITEVVMPYATGSGRRER